MAASEVTARLRQIAESRRPIRTIGGDPPGDDRSAASAADIRGVRAIDHGLIAPGRGPAPAELISVATNPDPSDPDSVVVRLDGWEGHLLLVLPRDRAALLARKLDQAVEMSRDWAAAGSGPRSRLGPVVDSSPPPKAVLGRRTHGLRRHRPGPGVHIATDEVLEELAADRLGVDTDPRDRRDCPDEDA